jgi:hypothetical protein
VCIRGHHTIACGSGIVYGCLLAIRAELSILPYWYIAMKTKIFYLAHDKKCLPLSNYTNGLLCPLAFGWMQPVLITFILEKERNIRMDLICAQPTSSLWKFIRYCFKELSNTLVMDVPPSTKKSCTCPQDCQWYGRFYNECRASSSVVMMRSWHGGGWTLLAQEHKGWSGNQF